VSTLQRLLASVASVYDDLLDASLPGSGGDPDERPAPDPTRKPAPGDLGVLEHRHKLVRGLRWWVDAVHERGERVPRMGQDVALMASYLSAREEVMAPEDQDALEGHLRSWLVKSARIMGEPDRPPAPLPVEAWDRVVPQSLAAQALGVSVSTVWRRAGSRGGAVRLGDVTGPRCELHDLLSGQCADCA